MKETELRIGNLLKRDSHIVRVLQIRGNNKVRVEFLDKSINENQMLIDLSELQPIPITEEILLKIKSVEKDYDVLEDCTMFIFGEVGEYKLIIILHDGKFLYEWQTEIDYLHELQNLFYAINKTEFEINL